MGKILVVLEDREKAALLVKKGIALALAQNMELLLFKHSYDSVDEVNRYIGFDDFEELKQRVIEDDSHWLDELMASTDFEGITVSGRAVWYRRLYEGVLAQAEECDMILKAANVHNRISEVIHTPDDWSIMREAVCPVMLARPGVDNSGKAIVVAINALDEEQSHYDLHQRVLEQASALAKGLNSTLVVVAAIPMFNYNVPYFVGVGAQYPELQTSLRNNAKQRLNKMLQEYSVEVDKIVIEDGYPEQVVEHVCKQQQAQMLVIGTVANKGVAGVFIGNTAERVLHHINQDVMVIG